MTVLEKVPPGLVAVVPVGVLLSLIVTTELAGAYPEKEAVLSGTVAVTVTSSLTEQLVAGKIGVQEPASIA